MNSYDSDSSLDDDDQSGTSTNVLLGYATKDAVDDSISQLGGEPVRRTPPSLRPSLCTYSANIDMALARSPSLRLARQMPILQQPHGPPPAVKWRATRPLPRPRAPPVHLRLQAARLPEETR